MQNVGIKTSVTSDGFLLFDASMKLIYINRTAVEILCYPQRPEAQRRLDNFLSAKISMTLFSTRSAQTPVFVSEFLSGRRRYQCRAYRVDGPGNGNGNGNGNGKPHGSIAVLLERVPAGGFSLGLVSEKFHLTSREQEVLRHLLLGRTTKEIASGMEISPHTVKAFLRMIMVKMGVSTRSAILGKALTARDRANANVLCDT